MKKNLLGLAVLLLFFNFLHAQKHLILNTTGYGFDRNAFNGVNPEQWTYIQKFTNLTYNGQDASPTAIRLHIQWEQYEPTLGSYNGTKLAQAIAAIVALKPGMKVALHFAYMRPGAINDSYFAENEIAKIYDGTKVQKDIAYTCPSLFSPTAKAKFYAMVDNAMAAVSAHYSNILYVTLGNASAEEYHIPHFEKNGQLYPGFYEQAALDSWRNDYLTCRYPGQSSVTWDGTTYTIATAPSFFGGEWGGWNNGQHGREYQRFGAWGEMKFFTGFRDIVKSKSSSLKVIYFVSHFGSSPGSYLTLTNATLPRALNESDGIYSSDNYERKYLVSDVIKGTNMNKIAGIEFDPVDLGQQENPMVVGINPNAAMEGFVRAYKHGVDYVHLAMHFHDPEIQQVAPAMAHIRANYVNGSYVAPARQPSIAESIVPKIWTGADMFSPAWAAAGGNNWASSDLNPRSIAMNDDGYWENVWSCGTVNPCDFTPSVSTSNANPQPNTSITLTASATGQNTGITYTWSQNGLSGTGTTRTFNAPSTPGTYSYTVTASKTNCTSKTATVQITVPTQSGGTGCVVNKVRLQFRNSGDCCMSRLVGAKIQGSNNGSTWTDLYTFTGNGTGSFQDFAFSNTTSYSSARFVASSTGWGELRELEFYNGTTKLTGTTFGTDNYANAFDGNTATEWHAPTTPGPNNYAGMNFTGCSTPPACDFNMSASASPSSVTVSGTVNLSYTCSGANCTGVTYAWSGQGISGNQSPKAITAPATVGSYVYTITASKTGCANKTATATVTTSSGSSTYSQCKEAESMTGTGAITSDPNASNNQTRGEQSNYNHYVDYTLTSVPTAGTYYVTLRYYSSAAPTVGVQVNSGGTQTLNLPNSGSWNIVWADYQFSVNLNAGNNTIRISGTGGGSCRQDRICVSHTSGSPAMLGVDPAEINTLKALSVLPNPNNGIFQTDFYLEKGKKATIIISDLQGRIIYRQSVIGQGQHREKINLMNKASGTLLLQLQSVEGTQLKKISIAR